MHIYGAGGHGKVVYDVINRSGDKITAFIDDNSQLITFCSKPVVQKLECENLILAIGNNTIRKQISNKFKSNVFKNAFDPKAIISSNTIFGIGNVVMAGVVVNRDTTLSNHIILNTNCTIEHDCNIYDFVHVSPGATLCGNVQIGEGTHIGANAVVLPGVKIGVWCKIGAGSVIINDVPDNCIVVGNPGRIIKYGDETQF